LHTILTNISKRMCMSVLIKIQRAASNGVHYTIEERATIDVKSKIVNKQLQVCMLESSISKIRESNIFEAFWDISQAAKRNKNKSFAMDQLDEMFKQRKKMYLRQLVVGSVSRQSSELEATFKAIFVLHIFFNKRHVSEKSHFFGRGKRLFEIDTVERITATGGNGRGKLIKSNSLIVASANNIYNGFLKLEKLRVLRVRNSFR
jgi:hypothetical protein